jgi:multidrug efflux system membrane fusion protein
MKRGLAAAAAAVALLAIGSGAGFLAASWHRGPELPTAPPAAAANAGNGMVTVTADRQAAAGLETARVHPATALPVQLGFATAADTQPLIDLVQRTRAAEADAGAKQVQTRAAREQAGRMRELYRSRGMASLRSVQEADAAAESADAGARAAAATLASLRSNLVQQFGGEIASLLSSATPAYARLVNGQATLLRVVRAPGMPPAALPETVLVGARDLSSHATARRLARAPQADPALQAEAWFYLTDRPVPVGLRLEVYAPTQAAAGAALLVPASALFWFAGERWAYVQIAPDRFVRRAVAADTVTAQGALVRAGYTDGDAVVVRGAQLLLAEEQKPYGVTTQCKDPPECDD